MPYCGARSLTGKHDKDMFERMEFAARERTASDLMDYVHHCKSNNVPLKLTPREKAKVEKIQSDMKKEFQATGNFAKVHSMLQDGGYD